MEQQIGAFEAKTHFSQLVEKVEQGVDFVITRRGKPVAKLVPFEREPEMAWEAALAAFAELRENYRGGAAIPAPAKPWEKAGRNDPRV